MDYNTFTQGFYASDLIFAEEKEAEEQEMYKPLQKQDSDILEGQQSKEFIEFNFQLQYTSDEETPLRAVVDIPTSEQVITKPTEEERKTPKSSQEP